MAANLLITPVVPTLAGTLFATTAIEKAQLKKVKKEKVESTEGLVEPQEKKYGDPSDLYDLVPVSSSMRTLVVLTNTDGSNPHTAEFTSQPDTWGNEPTGPGSDLDKIITVPMGETVITGVWIRPRWGDPASSDFTCTVIFDSPADFEIAVINVPNASKD